MKQDISIIIPVYKNKELFLKLLNSNMPFIEDYEIIIVDDASDEQIGSVIRKDFPDIRVIEHDKNMGFAPTVNDGAKAASGTYLMFLNSDVKILKHFSTKLTKNFDDPDVFAVSFMQIEKDGSKVGKNILFFRDGFPQHSKATDLKLGLNGWAEGGSCIVRKDYFEKLGGFNELYAPFYWEDIDLSYRAYSRGWKVLFDPEIVVEHHHESTIGTFFTRRKINTIAHRNQCIFTWCNMTDTSLLKDHLKLLPKHTIRSLMSGKPEFITGLVQAVLRLPEVRLHRSRKANKQRRSDKDIFSLFTS